MGRPGATTAPGASDATSPAEERLRVRCPACGNVLGLLVAGQVVIKHRGREWIGTPSSIRCDRCPGVWMPPERERMALAERETRAQLAERRRSGGGGA